MNGVFESLEDRRLLATHIWQGPTLGLWSDPANWIGGAPSSGEAGGTIVQFDGGVIVNQDIAGLVVDRIHFTTGTTVIQGTTALGLNGSVLDDNILIDEGAATLANGLPLVLSGDDVEITLASGQLFLNAGISGGFGVNIDAGAGGTVTYGNSSANSYSGVTTVKNGTVQLASAATNGAIAGDLIVGDGAEPGASASLVLLSPDQIADDASVTVNADGVFDNFSEAIDALAISFGQVDTGAIGDLQVTGELTMKGGTIIGSAPLRLSGNTSVNTSAVAARIDAPIDLNGGTRTLLVPKGVSPIALELNGEISNGGVIQAGAGFIRIDGNNTFSGGYTLTSGTVALAQNSAMGTGRITISGGAIQALDNDIILSNPVTVDGDFAVDAFASVTFAGAVTLTGDRNIDVFLPFPTTFSGGIFEDAPGYAFSKTGPGTIAFDADNFYTGDTIINDGRLQVNAPSNNRAIPGDLVIGSNIRDSFANVELFAPDQIADDAAVTILSGGRFAVSAEVIAEMEVDHGFVDTGFSGGLEILGPLTLTEGAVNGFSELRLGGDVFSRFSGRSSVIRTPVNLLGSTRTFTVEDGFAENDVEVTGVISDGALVKEGAGTLILAGGGNVGPPAPIVEEASAFLANNSYAGETQVNAGALFINGEQPESSVVVSASALLGGGGVAGDVLVNEGAILAPGFTNPFGGGPPAIVALAEVARPAVLTTGDLTLSAGSTFSIVTAGAGPAPAITAANFGPPGLLSVSSVKVEGAVNLNSSLIFTLESEFEVGEVFTIIENDGSDAVNGTFADLAEGAIVFSSGAFPNRPLRISYVGEDGNDVTLTLLNQNPEANDDEITIFNSEEAFLDLVSNDTDLEARGFSIVSFTQPAEGGTAVSVGAASQLLRFAPTPGFEGTVTFTYTIEDADGGQDTATVTLTIADDSDPGDFDNQVPDGSNERFVRNLYEDIFGREADSEGLDFWNRLLNDGVSRTAVAKAFLGAGEYVLKLGQEFYAELLNRNATVVFDSGLNLFIGSDAFWFNVLYSGVEEEQVIAGIVSSPEYALNKGATDNAFITSLYQDVLGRAADGEGFAFFAGELAAGTSRAEVALEFLNSPEFHSLLLDDPTGRVDFYEGWIQDYFEGSLEASKPGFDDYFARLAAGDRWSDVQADILDSDEYFTSV